VIEVKGTHQRLLKLRITAHSAKAMNVEIAARIRDGFGGSVGFAPVGSLMSESPAQLDMGSTTFEMSIDVSRLALGQYMLSLELTKPFAEIFDFCEDCLSFDLGSEHFSDVLQPFRQDWQNGSVLFDSRLERVS
jgi:lipopolysaccharide transport system ATP-binding protein